METILLQTFPIMKANFDYQPRSEDELRLKKGDVVVVLETFSSGWFLGVKYEGHIEITETQLCHSLKLFPGSFVSPVADPDESLNGWSQMQQQKLLLSLISKDGEPGDHLYSSPFFDEREESDFSLEDSDQCLVFEFIHKSLHSYV